MSGARQITAAHVRLQLEAAEVPIEGSPAAGLHDEPQSLPPLEDLPEAVEMAEEVQRRLEGGAISERRRAVGEQGLQTMAQTVLVKAKVRELVLLQSLGVRRW